jgi:hypothetical protein
VSFQGDGFPKPVVARFDLPAASADGGLLLFKALDTELGLSRRLAACRDDRREPGKVVHETIELLQQRIFGLCGGYADCNDAARLVHDPIHKLVLDRDPLSGLGLASQPTLSRFENAVRARELRALTHVLADTVIGQQQRWRHGRARRITIDLDPTDDPTHGQQECAFFNGHYDTWCYLPVVATVTCDDEAAQFAVAAILRPGKAPATLGARGILRGLLRKLRGAFPAATFRVRLDGGFASPKMLGFLEREEVEYVVAMASNRRLDKRAQRLMGRARVSRAGPARRRTCTARRAMRPRSGRASGGSSSKPKWSAIRAARPRTIRGSWSPTSSTRRRRCTSSTATGATWRIGSRSCITGWRWIGPGARSSGPTSSGCCLRWRPPSCFRRCGAGP